MKLSHKLCGAALVAVAGVALAVPNTTKAENPDSATGTGHIKFSYTETDPTVPKPDRSSGETGPVVTSNDTFTIKNPGQFGLVAVTPLEFGSHNVVTANATRDYDALAYDNGNDVTMANFVQFQDYRDGADHQYTLSANISSNFQSAEGNFFKAATLTYNNAWVQNQDLAMGDELKPVGVSASTVLTGGDTKDAAGASVVFINNTSDTGFGAYALNFGDSKLDTAASSVTLGIPTENNIVSGDYNAVITWTLASTVTP